MQVCEFKKSEKSDSVEHLQTSFYVDVDKFDNFKRYVWHIAVLYKWGYNLFFSYVSKYESLLDVFLAF